MTERDLGRLFVDFLTLEKGYPKASILLEAPLADKNNYRRYIADLILLDTEHDNYLAVVEFKARLRQPKQDALSQVKTYLKVIDKPNLPAYLVIPKDPVNGEVDFCIQILDSNDWREVKKVDFPHYETLSSKYQADEKKEIKDIDEIKQQEVQKKKELIRGTAWSSLASLVAAIIATIVLSQNIFFNEESPASKFFESSASLDSLQNQQRQLHLKLVDLEKAISQVQTEDSLVKPSGSTVQLAKLNGRISNIESLINRSPERLLSLQELNYRFQALKTSIESGKELGDAKISNLKERIDQLTIWTSGLIIAIIGSIIGFAFNTFRRS